MNYIQQSDSKFDFGHLKNVRYNSALHLGERTNYDRKHAFQVMKIAGRIFDFIKLKFELNDEDREYLEAASLLHDIGYYISHSDHHKHSYYIIRHSEMLGFNDKEIEIIANIARYHRKSHPKLKHDNFSKLDQKNQNLVRKLSGVLRIADALDRSHKSIVNDIDISLKNNLFELNLKSCNADPSLEIWGVNVRKGLFEESFGYEVVVKTKIKFNRIFFFFLGQIRGSSDKANSLQSDNDCHFSDSIFAKHIWKQFARRFPNIWTISFNFRNIYFILFPKKKKIQGFILKMQSTDN